MPKTFYRVYNFKDPEGRLRVAKATPEIDKEKFEEDDIFELEISDGRKFKVFYLDFLIDKKVCIGK